MFASLASFFLSTSFTFCPSFSSAFLESSALSHPARVSYVLSLLPRLPYFLSVCRDPFGVVWRPYLFSYGDGISGIRESYYGYFGREGVPIFWYRRLPLVPVLGVMDGDTVEILYEGQKERIRMIGVDTPESVHPTKPVECFGQEASSYTKKHLTGAWLYFDGDATQSRRDHYGRLLGYLYTIDGVLYNEQLIREGYAHEYTYGKGVPYRYQAQFQRAEYAARAEKRGLWSPSTCHGKD